MWGCPEAVELQVLQLMELRYLAQRTTQALENPGAVFDAYSSYLSRRFPRQPQRPLFELVGQDDEKYSKLAGSLRGFVEEEMARAMAPHRGREVRAQMRGPFRQLKRPGELRRHP
jgi:hypothetical protein